MPTRDLILVWVSGQKCPVFYGENIRGVYLKLIEAEWRIYASLN